MRRGFKSRPLRCDATRPGGRVAVAPTCGYLERIENQPADGADWRDERLAQNEVFFRTVNEGIEQQAIRFGGDDDYEFICECASRACLDRVSLTLREYEHIRAAGTRFVVVPGHENVELELVVQTARSFNVVEKDGAAGIVADFSDPRDGDVQQH